jgi:ubiquinone/menaquinone biosynthesis C-methylase UbiE
LLVIGSPRQRKHKKKRKGMAVTVDPAKRDGADEENELCVRFLHQVPDNRRYGPAMERRGTHAEEIERAFTTQADAFEDPARNRVFTADSAWAFDRLPRVPGDLGLDVAAGTGHAARQLAPSVAVMVAVDATEAMLARGREQARREGLLNVVYMQGEAEALPFLAQSFDIAVCRFAMHHFERPEAVIAELARCTRAGGHVAVVDLIAHQSPDISVRQNQLERLRDPSHTRMLAERELVDLMTEAGLALVNVETRGAQRPLAPWLAQSATPPDVAERIRRSLRSELSTGADPTGFAPRECEREGELWFNQTFAACVAVRRPVPPTPE